MTAALKRVSGFVVLGEIYRLSNRAERELVEVDKMIS